MKVAVVGCGYVGLISAVGLASVGHEVVGIEMDATRREAIAAGRAPFHEPGLAELLGSTLADGSFRVSASLESAKEADVVLLAVQTPPDASGANDHSYLAAATSSLAGVFADDDAKRVVVVRSTVVPGTAATVVTPLFDDAGVGARTAVASNPEFLREGSALADFLNPDRVVVGCDEAWGLAALTELYEPLGAPIVTTTPATAELAKYTSNAFLATLISFSNEIGRICESLPGVDVEDVLGILHQDRRLRPRVDGVVATPEILSYLKAGCGYGGSCLPKDLSALIQQRAAAGEDAPLLRAVRDVNEGQPRRLVGQVVERLGGLDGRTVAVLGVAFKGGTDDLRASPGLAVLDALLDEGADVVIHDPLVEASALAAYTERGARVMGLQEACTVADACVVTTNAEEFAALPGVLAALDAPPVVVDGRRALRGDRFPPGRYQAVGVGPDRLDS